MIVTVFIHSIEEPMAKEVCTFEEMEDWTRAFGVSRLEKIILTDFRPVIKKDEAGREQTICP